MNITGDVEQQIEITGETLKSEVDRLKKIIRLNAHGPRRQFSGEGYIFRTALREIRSELKGSYTISYEQKADVYTISEVTNP